MILFGVFDVDDRGLSELLLFVDFLFVFDVPFEVIVFLCTILDKLCVVVGE